MNMAGAREAAGYRFFVGMVLLFLLVIFFQEPFIRLFPGSAIKYLDEVFVIGVLAFLVVRALVTGRTSPLFLLSCAVLAYFVVVSMLGFQSSMEKIVVQSVIHWKFFVFLMALDLVQLADPGGKSIRKLFVFVMVVSIAGFLLNLLLQERFLDFFNVPPAYRAGILRIEGFQLKPNDLGIHLGIAFIYYFVFRFSANLANIVFFTALFFLLILITGSRAALAAIPITLLVYFVYTRQWKVLGAMLLMTLLGLVVFSGFVQDMLQRTIKNVSELSDIENSLYIRGIMVYYGFVLLLRYFPIGTGAATFGSVESGGSPVYEDLGLSDMRFFEQMEGIYDSNLATISGEFGAMGLLLFGIALAYVYYRSKARAAGNSRKMLYFRVVLIFMLLVAVVNPLFMYSYNALLFALAFKVGEVAGDQSLRSKPASRSLGTDHETDAS